jgi:hypothetical protein
MENNIPYGRAVGDKNIRSETKSLARIAFFLMLDVPVLPRVSC